MAVVGRNAYILADLHKSVDVSPFTPDYAPLTVPLVDAALQYDCPYSGESYTLILRNALSVPSISNNLLPLFLLREAGLQVKEVPKIHIDHPGVEHHAITFPDTNFCIPLQVWGTFSYFTTYKPTLRQLEDPTHV